MFIYYVVIIALTLGSNLCICTETCMYSLYADGVTNFYNMTVRGAVLHNKIVDLGIQPCFILTIILMYMITGFKIMKIRRQIRTTTGQSKNDGSVRKRRMEIMLVIQGILISAPQTITAALYHIMIYITLPNAAKLVLNFISSFSSKLVFAASPFFYLALNTDMRVKLATLLAGERANVNAVSIAPISTVPARSQATPRKY